ncbi:MAG: tyrosine-type recombinase/integrase [Rubrobacter sp.]|nr:tyrosine-type recombinase/integrase [Rubrobacter sp.]
MHTARSFKPILKRAGLPRSVRLHDLRHTCATLLLCEGVHPKLVQELLGHLYQNRPGDARPLEDKHHSRLLLPCPSGQAG